ncbi:hypothetical protein ABE444_10085 [Brevundimonas pondensis]|uniref:hypothetical protein n=1 Tax=Brevundimonas pondensis TaxID=2774189 RepID=UPI0028D084AF|nr:hypothetical protein [uncultured Brevundimonas sp.]
MTTFTVSFDPKLPSGGETSPPKEPDWSRIYAITKGLEYDMTYHVGGQAFGYYPTDVVGLLSDLIGAREALDRGQNGSINMSGYTVLLVEVSGASLVFSDPYPSKWRCEVRAEVVREALDQALRDVWSFVISLDQPSST